MKQASLKSANWSQIDITKLLPAEVSRNYLLREGSQNRPVLSTKRPEDKKSRLESNFLCLVFDKYLIQVIQSDVSGNAFHQSAFVTCIFVGFASNKENPFVIDDKVTFGRFKVFFATIVSIDGLRK